MKPIRVASPQARQVTGRLEELMHEIKVADLATDSPEFGGVKRAALDRYDRLYKQHVPDGRLPYRRDASQREIPSVPIMVRHFFPAKLE